MEQDDESDEPVGGSAQDGSHGSQLGCALRVANLTAGEFVHAAYEEFGYLQQNKGKK